MPKEERHSGEPVQFLIKPVERLELKFRISGLASA